MNEQFSHSALQQFIIHFLAKSSETQNITRKIRTVHQTHKHLLIQLHLQGFKLYQIICQNIHSKEHPYLWKKKKIQVALTEFKIKCVLSKYLKYKIINIA